MTDSGQVVVLFFGSFNPIHVGHLAVANAAAARPEVQEVRLIVTPANPHKDPGGLAPAEVRLAWVTAALEGHKNLTVSDIEFHLPPPHYTAETLRALERMEPHLRFSLLIGADTLRTLHTWKDAHRLAAHRPLYVYPRHGEDGTARSVWETEHPEVEVIRMPGDLHPFASTEVRKAFRLGLNPQEMLPPPLRGDGRLATAYGPQGQVLL